MYKTNNINVPFKNQYIELQNNDVENTANGKIFQHIKLIENNSLTPGSAIICEMNNKFLLIKSYRYAVDRECWEIPRGYTNHNESLEDCAARELHEEINVGIDNIASTEILGTIDVNSAILASSVAIVHLKIKNDFLPIIQEDESISDYKWLTIDELKDLIDTQLVTDSFTISGFMLYLIKH